MFWILFCIFLAACLGAGATGGLFPPGPWYRSLNKPSWTPPDWIFPLTWMILYVCMATAGARAGMTEGNGIAMAFWALQISFNGLWTPVFFGLRNIRIAMAIILVLWLTVFGAMVALWQVDAIAGILFIPYLVWVTIAAALNAAVWNLNREAAAKPNDQPG